MRSIPFFSDQIAIDVNECSSDQIASIGTVTTIAEFSQGYPVSLWEHSDGTLEARIGAPGTNHYSFISGREFS